MMMMMMIDDRRSREERKGDLRFPLVTFEVFAVKASPFPLFCVVPSLPSEFFCVV